MSSRQLCFYATDSHTRPDCALTPVLAFGAVHLCASCAVQRSTLGKGQPAKHLHAAEIDVLAWLSTAEQDLRTARDVLHSAAQRARQHGHSWQSIGDQLGISRQAAQQRFSPASRPDPLDR